MRRGTAFCCLAVVLCLVIAWELGLPQRSVEGHDTAAPAGLQTGEAGSIKVPSPAPDSEALVQVAATITARPLFSPTRRPANLPADAISNVSVSEQGLPRLTGTIVGPSGGRAIFAGADGKSRTATEGDIVGAFKVRAIDPGRVTLSGSEGDRVLRPTFVTSPVTNASSPGATAAVANKTLPDTNLRRGGR